MKGSLLHLLRLGLVLAIHRPARLPLVPGSFGWKIELQVPSRMQEERGRVSGVLSLG